MKEFKETLTKLRGLIAISLAAGFLITLIMILISAHWITYIVLFITSTITVFAIAIVVKAILDGRERKESKK